MYPSTTVDLSRMARRSCANPTPLHGLRPTVRRGGLHAGPLSARSLPPVSGAPAADRARFLQPHAGGGGFDGSIRVRRYLCRSCRRTVSLLPQFALPYLRFGITVISLFLVARLLQGATLAVAAAKAAPTTMPYQQRGQFWVRRFSRQAAALCAALAALCAPAPASNFVCRALHMLESIGWVAAHRFLFAGLRMHLLGWPAFLAPDGRVATLRPAAPPA